MGKKEANFICLECGNIKYTTPYLAKKSKFCSKKCSQIHCIQYIMEYQKDPKNKIAISKKNSIAGKKGYGALERWYKENPILGKEQRIKNGKKAIKIRKERGTYHNEMVLAGKKGSIEDKRKAAKINVEKNISLLRENSKKYGHLGGKIYIFDNKKFRSKSEIVIYNLLKNKKKNFLVNKEINGKEFDFVLFDDKIILEFHPYHPHYDKRNSQQYFKDRKEILDKSEYRDYKLLVFQKINHIKEWLGEK